MSHNKQIVKSRGVTRLCHFTKSSNFPYILGEGKEESNGLISNQKVKEAQFLSLNDLNRYDGRPELICTSLQYPNFFFFDKSRKNNLDDLLSDWVIILISPEIIDENTYFCPVNAATQKGKYISRGSDSFEKLFAIEIENSKASPRNFEMASNVPTDNQAELLFENDIPKEAIIGLVFSSKEQAIVERLRLKLCNVSLDGIGIYFSNKWYDKHSAYELINGHEIPLTELEE